MIVKVGNGSLDTIEYSEAHNHIDPIVDDRTGCIAHIWVPSGPIHSVSTYLSYISASHQVRSTYDSQSYQRLPGIY